MSKIFIKIKAWDLKVVEMVIFYFILYGFLGWILDSLYSTLSDGRLVFGGMFKSFFLPIPFAPIYGFGALILIGFQKFLESRGHFSLLFLAGLILSAVEYAGGLFTVAVLHHRAWNYSQSFANLQGHVDLWHSFLWMFLGWFFIRFLHPLNKKIIEDILRKIRRTT